MKSLPKVTAVLTGVLMLSQPIAAMAQTQQQGYVGPSSVPQNYGGPSDGQYQNGQSYQGQQTYQGQQSYQAQTYQGQSYQGQGGQYQGQTQGGQYQGQTYQGQPQYSNNAPPPPPPPGTQTGPNTYAANGGAPAGAAPPPPGGHYDGYCYQRKDDAQATGTVLGAVAGGLIGNSVSNRWNRGSGTVAGAVLGAVVGNSIGRSSVQCYGGHYYAYDQNGYYAPPAPPEGYSVVYYDQRPPVGYYSDVVVGPSWYYGPRYHYYRPHYRRW